MTEFISLIKQVEAGNREAAREFIDEYQVKVYNICMSFVHNEHDAEDITQDVFIEILQHIGSFRGDSKPGTWIYRIAVNRSLNFIRKNKRMKWWKPIEEILFSGGSKSEEPSVYNSGLEENEQKQMLSKAIDSLPEKQRVAFSLNKLDDLSYAEVAEVMDLSLSAVESLIHRAKLNLQKSLEVYYYR
jgi:RNA polymerase sigma-70 factor, ECF subfamily